MPLIRVQAVFWHRISETNWKTLHKLYKGQYDLRMPQTVELAGFLGNLPRRDETNLGGYYVDIPIQSFDGDPGVPEATLSLKYMGPESERKDWLFPGQATEPYPLWAPGRGPLEEWDAGANEYIVLIRDAQGQFHARWQHGTSDLPEPLRQLLTVKSSGVWEQAA